MNILILSCDTGGGHNSAARSIQKELIRRGHQTVFLNPFELSGKRVAGAVGGAYVRLVQKHPRAFGMLYKLGALVSRVPGKSPGLLCEQSCGETSGKISRAKVV